MASPSRERYGRWKEKELGLEKEEFFGEEEGKEELEGEESTYDGSSGDLTSSTSSNGKEEVEEDNGDKRVFLSSLSEEEEEEEEEEEQEEEEEWSLHAPLHMEGLQGKGGEMKGKRRRKKMHFCLKNQEVMRVVHLAPKFAFSTNDAKNSCGFAFMNKFHFRVSEPNFAKPIQ